MILFKYLNITIFNKNKISVFSKIIVQGENIMKNILHKIIQMVFILLFLIVGLIIIFNNDKKYFIPTLFNNKILFLFGMLFIIIILILLKKCKIKISEKSILIILSSILFLIEIIIMINAAFRSGWDVGMLYDAAYLNIFNSPNKINFTTSKYYFEMYPNNVCFLLYEMFWAFITKVIGKGPKTLSLILILNNCIIYVVVGVLMYLCIKKLTKSCKISLLAWFMYFILIGTSSWFLIPYSDSLGLLFPTLVLFIYLYYQKNPYFKIFLISIISFLGYQIKPQIIIIFIAIIILEAFNILNKDLLSKKNILKLSKKVLIICLSYFLISIPLSFTKNYIMELDQNKKIGLSHFLMMGLNVETSGKWSGEDISYSSSFLNQKSRTKGNLEVIKQRLHNLGPLGLMKHLKNKTLVNFNDGTFYFGEEGSFYVYEYYDNKYSKLIKDFVYSNGKYYIYLSTVRQAIWLNILIFMLFSYGSKNKNVLIIQLSLIGLLIFETLFEARSRYLFIYVPYFIMLFSIGIKKIHSKVRGVN